MDALLNIDKPPGPTSFAVVARIRRFSRIRRVGHAGTLDPSASGVLLVLLGQATRAARFFEALPKEYLATVRLGMETDTDDLEGKVVSQSRVPDLQSERLEEVLAGFTGEISQVPPRYSALKKDGTPLYRLAREGRPHEPAPRTVTIQSIGLLDLRPIEIDIRVSCSKGTYIRALARDIGKALGCGGALAGLRRTAVGHYNVGNAAELDKLDANNVLDRAIPLDRALDFLPSIDVNDGEAQKAGHGNDISGFGELNAGTFVRIRHRGRLVAIGQAGEGLVHPSTVFERQVRTEC